MKCLKCGATAPPNLNSSLCSACMATKPKSNPVIRQAFGFLMSIYIAIIIGIFAGFCWLMYACFHAMSGGSDQPQVNIGDYAHVSDQMWCMESKDALSELQDYAARNATDEANRVFVEKGVMVLPQGIEVKVLDMTAGGSVKVRTAQGQECWTVSNVLSKSQ